MHRIHYTKPCITELEAQHALDTAANGSGERSYEYITRFEELFRHHLRVPYAIVSSSCTGALDMGLAGMSLGPGNLERIDELVERKHQIFNWYEERRGKIEGITLNYEAPHTRNTYWMVTVVLDKKFGLKKETVMTLMSEKGIDCRPFFHPLSSIPAHRDSKQAAEARQRNENAYKVSPYGVNLPCGLNMTEEKVDYVCGVLKLCLGAV